MRVKRTQPECIITEAGGEFAVRRAKKGKVATTAVANGSDQQPPPFYQQFQALAAGWIKAETNFYDSDSRSDYQPIDCKGKEQVNNAHLEKATKEYKTRFSFCTEEEDAESDQYSSSPYLLVATNLLSTWSPPNKHSRFRFMLVQMQDDLSALFITLMPGNTHGTIDGFFSDCIGEYLRVNSLYRAVCKCHSGGGTYQPDIKLYPKHPYATGGPNPDRDDDAGAPYGRVVVEFEFGNRNADALREVGYAVLNNAYGSLFIGIKVWRKDSSGSFGAALVVWEKDHVSGAMRVRDAFDFGSKSLQANTKNAWRKGAPVGANWLPPVPVNRWNRPQAVALQAQAIGQPPPPIPPGWSLNLPKDSLFYRMPSNNAQPLVLLTALNLPDLAVDLREFQDHIDGLLDMM